MSPQVLQSLMHEEIAKFQKIAEELRLLRAASRDLKRCKRMVLLKRFD